MQVYLGEAAVNQGAFHESLNMAALWKLPLVVIVENNRFGMGTAWERASSLYDISQKASAYAMPSAIADGMDVLDMYRVAKEAVDRARAGEGPTLIEARTYRFVGHSMSDPVSRRLPHQGGGRGGEAQRPHPHLRQPPRRPRRPLAGGAGGDGRGGQARLRGGRRVRREVAGARGRRSCTRTIYADEDVAGRLYFDGGADSDPEGTEYECHSPGESIRAGIRGRRDPGARSDRFN
jgi:hypothetical protein